MPRVQIELLRSRPPSIRPVLSIFMLLGALLLLPHLLQAQAAPAVRGGQGLWVGGEYSNFTPDFGAAQRLTGPGVYVDLNWNGRYAFEGEARFLRFNGLNGQYEDNYLFGPKISFFRRGKFRPYGKFLIGVGKLNFPYQIGYGTYFAMAPGGGLDYRLSRRITLRAEYEYQIWPNAPGIAGIPNDLKPNGFSAGVAYRIPHLFH